MVDLLGNHYQPKDACPSAQEADYATARMPRHESAHGRFRRMKRIVGLPFDADQSGLLRALSEFEGLHHRPVRRGEKQILNEGHKMVPYKLDRPANNVRIQTPQEKAFVLLQAAKWVRTILTISL